MCRPRSAGQRLAHGGPGRAAPSRTTPCERPDIALSFPLTGHGGTAVSQLNVIVIHIRREQADEYERLFEDEELPRWREYHAAGRFLHARFYGPNTAATSATRCAST